VTHGERGARAASRRFLRIRSAIRATLMRNPDPDATYGTGRRR
jgi:hypothetical protein